jgi:hypothetical protein
LGFKNFIISEARGFSGGNWNKINIQVIVIQEDFYFLHVQVRERVFDHWLLFVVYASPRGL